jgi:hypothetical protein
MGSGGVGSPQHMYGELFKMMAGVDMLHVPYRGGAPALTDLLAGQVQVMFDTLARRRPYDGVVGKMGLHIHQHSSLVERQRGDSQSGFCPRSDNRNPRVQIPCYREIFPCYASKKFPVLLRRECGWKPLNSLADWVPKSRRRAGFSKIPC